MNARDIGKRIRTHRKLMGMTQEELARAAGVSPSFIGHIERGTRNVSLDILTGIAGALGVSCSSLMDGASPSAPAETTGAAFLREDAESEYTADSEADIQALMLRELIELLEKKD